MINSISYLVCLNINCKDSGKIRKNLNKCNECKKNLIILSLEILNIYFCINGKYCDVDNCKLIHPCKPHNSPPYISPCIDGIKCKKLNCLFLHPNKVGKWLSIY
jgi:hypothetical protein